MGEYINKKYQQKDKTHNWIFLIDSSFQGVNIFFVLLFEYKGVRNVMIDEEKKIDWPVKNNLRKYENILKTGTSQDEDYTTRYLLDYNFFKSYCKMIQIGLSKQQVLDVDPKALQ